MTAAGWRLGRAALASLGGGIGPDPRWLEAASAAGAVGWGLGVLLLGPGQIGHPGYVSITLFLPPGVLGLLFVAGGLLQGAAVLLNHVAARVPLAAAVGSGWLLVAYSVAVSLPGSPTVAVLATIGVFDAAAMLLLIGLAFRHRHPVP